MTSWDDIPDNDNRKKYPRFQAFEQNRPVIDQFKALAEKKGCSSAQLSIAFVLARGQGAVPIPGTKHVKYMQDNLGAVNVELTPDDLAEIDRIVASVPIVGERYADTSLLEA